MNCAASLLSHLRSKKYEKVQSPVSQKVIAEVEARVEKEKAAKKTSGKKKLQEFLQKHNSKPKMSFADYAAEPGNRGTLYKVVPATKAGALDKIACHACENFFPTSGFLSHLTTTDHKVGLTSSRFSEDNDFIESMRDTCVQASRLAEKVRHCATCNKDFAEHSWAAHLQGKKHRSGLGEQVELGGTDEGEFPSTLRRGEVSEGDDAVRALSSFHESTVPVFVAGEDMWALPCGYSHAEVAVCGGVELQMCVADTSRWGSEENPAVLPALVRVPKGRTVGVCYTVTRKQAKQLIKKNNQLNLRVCRVSFTEPNGTTEVRGHDALTFTYEQKVKVKDALEVCALCIIVHHFLESDYARERFRVILTFPIE